MAAPAATPLSYRRGPHLLMFLRYASIFIVTYTVLVVLGLLLWSRFTGLEEDAQMGLQLQSVHRLLDATYQVTPEPEWPALTERLAREMGFRLRVLPMSAAADELAPRLHGLLERGELVLSSHAHHSYQRLSGSMQVLVLDEMQNVEYRDTSSFLTYHLDEVVTVLIFMLAIVIPLYFLVYRWSRDVYVLGRVARSIQAGDFSGDVPVLRTRLVRPLQRALGEMSLQLRELMEGQRILSQAVAHETRTPLARMRFALELIQVDDNDDESSGLLDGILLDIGRLERLAAAGICYAELGRCPSFQREPLCARQLVEDLRAAFDGGAIGTALCFDTPGLLVLSANHEALLLALGNLIGNALRHASAQVVVSMQVEQEVVVIAVDDDGPGVAPSARRRIFQPYVQLRPHPDGFGLGLAMVQVIATRHGGHADVQDSSLGGARFRLLLPAHAVPIAPSADAAC